MNIKEKCLYKMPLASGMPFGDTSSHSLVYGASVVTIIQRFVSSVGNIEKTK